VEKGLEQSKKQRKRWREGTARPLQLSPLTGSQKLASPESGTETDSNKDTHTDTARTAEKKIGAYQKNKGQVSLKKEKNLISTDN